MLTTRVLLRRPVSYLKCSYASSRRFAQAAEESDDLTINLDVKLAPLPKKKPQRPPFVKNLFLGKFDHEVLTYPEVLTKERENQFNEWLAPIEDCVERHFGLDIDENVLPFEAIEQLRELGVFRASLSEEDNGFGLNATEYAKMVEILGKNPALASYVASRTEAVELLLKYGSFEQKRKYLPLFASGELIPTLAIAEDNIGLHKTPLGATAVRTDSKDHWKLNAEKIFVSNGNQANCFMVLANCTETDDTLYKPTTPTLFIVERSHGGITTSKTDEKLGQRGLESCSLSFKDTLVPIDNVVDHMGSGPKIMINLLTMGKQNVGSQAIAILQRFTDEVIKHAIEKQHYDKPLMTHQFAQEIIAKMTSSLYAIESMTYLTTGLMDQYEEQDCSVENAIVEAYSTRECCAFMYLGLQLVQRYGFLKEAPFQRLYRDAMALQLFNTSNTDLNTYIAIMGLHHTGSTVAESVQKQRNPFMYPKFILKELFRTSEAPDLGLDEHLHPSLQNSAKLLEKCVSMLSVCSEEMLVRHGSKVTEAQMELRRLAEMAMDTYAMTAALGRASRAYCTGIRHCDSDVLIAHHICFNGYHRVETNNTEIMAGDVKNCDDTYKTIARRLFKQKGYFPEHPLTKNIS